MQVAKREYEKMMVRKNLERIKFDAKNKRHDKKIVVILSSPSNQRMPIAKRCKVVDETGSTGSQKRNTDRRHASIEVKNKMRKIEQTENDDSHETITLDLRHNKLSIEQTPSKNIFRDQTRTDVLKSSSLARLGNNHSTISRNDSKESINTQSFRKLAKSKYKDSS